MLMLGARHKFYYSIHQFNFKVYLSKQEMERVFIKRLPLHEIMWLDAFSDTQATIYTFPSCITTVDLTGDGDNRLLIADIGSGSVPSKLKIYKGTGLSSELTLQEMPIAIAPIFIDNEIPRIPVVAVASSDYIYVYKNLRPFFRAVLPLLKINTVEQDIWGQVSSVDSMVETLKNLQTEIGISGLAVKSQHLLCLPPHERQAFIDNHKEVPLQRRNIVTCLSTLKKSHNDDDALSCLVIGTENCEIIVLHPETFTPIEEAKLTLSDVPVFLSTSGLFDIDYTLTCTTRTGQLLIGRRGWVAPLMQLSSPVGVVCLETIIVVALMDSSLNCFSEKGQRNWREVCPSPITCIQKIHLKQRNFELLSVGTKSGVVYMYSVNGEILDKITFEECISSIYYGQYGRESNSLVVITQGGNLHLKILKRNADFSPQLNVDQNNIVQTKMQIPKKTKLFVDQTLREREHSIGMHRAFQRDVFKAKLDTARELVKVLNTKQVSNLGESVKLSAEVLGLGPTFIIKLGILNIGSIACSDLALFLHWDDKFYRVTPPFINVPLLIPGPGNEIYLKAKVESISQSGISDSIKVIVIRKKVSQPVLVAIINMPPSEMTCFD